MTAQEEFKEQYKAIKNLRSRIALKAEYYRKLEYWNKNDSHHSAIQKALDELDTLKKEQKVLLKGKTFEEWQSFSKNLTYHNTKIKNAEKQLAKWQRALEIRFSMWDNKKEMKMEESESLIMSVQIQDNP